MNYEYLIESHTDDLIDMAYDALEGAEDLMRYHKIHGTTSLLVLTQFSHDAAVETVRMLDAEYNLSGKVVIEIGAGVGFLSMEIARIAKQVFAIEVDPAWTWIFTRSLYMHKPPNLTWIFGKAETMLPYLKGDIAIVFTRSGVKELKALAAKFAPQVVMPLELEDTKTDKLFDEEK